MNGTDIRTSCSPHPLIVDCLPLNARGEDNNYASCVAAARRLRSLPPGHHPARVRVLQEPRRRLQAHVARTGTGWARARALGKERRPGLTRAHVLVLTSARHSLPFSFSPPVPLALPSLSPSRPSRPPVPLALPSLSPSSLPPSF